MMEGASIFNVAQPNRFETEIPDEKVLRKVMELTQAPFDRIHRVKRLDVEKGEIEK